MSRQIQFTDLDDCEVQTTIPAEWLDPLAAALDLTYRTLRDLVETEEETGLTADQLADVEKLRRYFFSLWTDVDTLAVKFKAWRKEHERREK